MARYSRSTACAEGKSLPGGLRRSTSCLPPASSRYVGLDWPPRNCRTVSGPRTPSTWLSRYARSFASSKRCAGSTSAVSGRDTSSARGSSAAVRSIMARHYHPEMAYLDGTLARSPRSSHPETEGKRDTSKGVPPQKEGKRDTSEGVPPRKESLHDHQARESGEAI